MADKIDLTIDNIDAPASLAALALVCAAALKRDRQITLYVDPAGNIRTCPPEDVDISRSFDWRQLDAMEVHDAIRMLLSTGVEEESIKEYLAQRDLRKKVDHR